MYETIDCQIEGPVAVITLDRPEQLNTIVPPMLEELDATVTAAVRDDDVKVIVLQGAGRSFCAGFSLPTDSRNGTTCSRPTASGTPGGI